MKPIYEIITVTWVLLLTWSGPHCAAESCAAESAEQISVPILFRGFDRTEIFSRIEGHVAKVLVDIGDRVERGQVLVRMQVPELSSEVLRREKMVSKAEADLLSQEADVEAFKAKLDVQRAIEQLRAKELGRIERLVKSGALREEKLDEAEFAHQSVLAEVKRMEAEIAAAEAHLHGARAAIEVAHAELQKAQVMAEYLEIRAPFHGEIMQRNVAPGDLVQPGRDQNKALLVLVRTDRLRGIMMVMADHANLIRVGQPVIVEGVRGLEDEPIVLRVSRFARTLAEGSQMMRVEADADLRDGVNGHESQLKPGDYGRASIDVSEPVE